MQPGIVQNDCERFRAERTVPSGHCDRLAVVDIGWVGAGSIEDVT
jgi:hypothetical protein